MPPRRWASIATRSTSCSSPGCASCATARKSRCQSARASSSRSTSCSRKWASTPRAGSSPHARPVDGHRLRHRAGAQAVEREPGLLRPVRARADQLDPAQGSRLWAVSEPDPRWRAGRMTTSRWAWPRTCCGCRTSCATQPRRARLSRSRPSRRSWRRRSMPSTATVASSMPTIQKTSGYRLALVDATRVTLAAALGLLGISAPDSM